MGWCIDPAAILFWGYKNRFVLGLQFTGLGSHVERKNAPNHPNVGDGQV